jgi:predicted RNA-binding Zn ribbon-like protein
MLVILARMAATAFELIGGHLALDFVNTVDWRGDPARRRDLLATFEDLLRWATAAKLMTPSTARAVRAAAQRDQARATRSLRRARRLREVIARLLAAAGRDIQPTTRDVRRLNAFLAAALNHRRLEIGRTGLVWSWAGGERDAFDSLLWPIVLAAAELLASDSRAQVHECSGDGCGWLFLDTSRNRRRRWCTMRGCGNRAKARRFYERTREGSGHVAPATRRT